MSATFPGREEITRHVVPDQRGLGLTRSSAILPSLIKVIARPHLGQCAEPTLVSLEKDSIPKVAGSKSLRSGEEPQLSRKLYRFGAE